LKARSLGFGIIVVIAAMVVMSLLRVRGDGEPQFVSSEDHFKYGSIGTEDEAGVPYWIWQVLPRMCADKLPGPGGYASLGFVWEDGRELPVGFSKRNVWGVSSVAINCAFCHTATFRTQPGIRPTIVAAGPSHRIDPQAYVRFLLACAEDPRFNASEMLAEIERMTDLPWLEALSYRVIVIPTARRLLRQERAQYAWMDERPPWGKGRIDPFNPVKFRMLKLPLDRTIGNSDNVPVWNMKARNGMALHWDGLSTSLREVVLSSALGDGATRRSINLAGLERVERWIRERPAPSYPYPINTPLASAGREVYGRACGECHAPGRARTGTIIPIDEVGTDRHRLDMWTVEAADAYNRFADGYPWRFTGFRKTNGYVAVPLDGLWLRAPYLHNGSVPFLGEILERPENRTRVFYRGYDVYDPLRVGFISGGSEAERIGTRYDTGLPGNSNSGHLYGTDLLADEKKALLEFLKTL
jgi:processive rubber oxygenase RoxA-like protein